jgi:hypothetical protein
MFFSIKIQIPWIILFDHSIAKDDSIFLYSLSSWYANAYSEIIAGRVTYSEAKNRLKETNMTTTL